MKSRQCLFVALGVVFMAGMSSAGDIYPFFQGEVARELNKEAHYAELFSSNPLLQKLAQPGANDVIPAEELEMELKKAAAFIVPKTWPLVDADGKMPLPQVLIQEDGIVGGLDSMFRVKALSASVQEQTPMEIYALFWATLLDQHPQRAFALMAERAAVETVSTIDVLHVTASLGTSPGSHNKLTASPSKSDWEALHRSRNPCYRFLALEFFDSVPQSPEELLVRYRECLFGACGYMEGRALQAIHRNEDYREAVAKLLETYVASNPTPDDGTIPRTRDFYRDRIRHSNEFIQRIRDYIAKNGEKMPTTVSPTRQGSTPPANLGNPADTSPKKEPATDDTARPEPQSSARFPFVLVVIVAVGILALLVIVGLASKRRSS